LPAEQARDGELSDALATLRHKVEEAFEATGRVVEDGAVRADVREVARLLGDAVPRRCPVAETTFGPVWIM
jgi:hypothetical protein